MSTKKTCSLIDLGDSTQHEPNLFNVQCRLFDGIESLRRFKKLLLLSCEDIPSQESRLLLLHSLDSTIRIFETVDSLLERFTLLVQAVRLFVHGKIDHEQISRFL